MTSNGTLMYPFIVWPERNIAIDRSKADQSITLPYVLHDCNRHYSVQVAGVELEEAKHYARTCVYNSSIDITDLNDLLQ